MVNLERKRFSAKSPGKLATIDGGALAFVPDPLPANFKFNTQLWPLLAEAKQQIALLEGIGRNLPNPGLLLRPLEQREALQSSRLEGTYITAKEFLLFDLDDDENDDRGSWKEVNNYRKALRFGQDSDLPLCLRLIKEIHKILMQGIGRADVTPGEFRVQQVAIGVNRRFIPPPTTEVMRCLSDFEKYLNLSSEPDSLIHCFICHYQFETIHPFTDGNGRVGRLLLALMFHRLCGLTKPWLYLSDILERQRDDYCNALFEVSATGDWSGWLELCLKATVSQANETIRRCERLNSLRIEFTQRASNCGGNARVHQLVDLLFQSPFLRVANLPEVLGVSYPTAKADCERLVGCGILKLLSSVKLMTYYSQEIFDVAYEGIGE